MVSCCDFLHQKENATSTKDWIWDKEELESAFTEKTRAIVINTPHNPIGKVKIHIVYSFRYMRQIRFIYWHKSCFNNFC